MRRSAGFTLIELMIVVAVLAILAVLAYPSYVDQVRKARRQQARETLAQVANQQERYYAQNGQYGSLTQLGYGGASFETTDGHFKVTLTLTNETILGSARNTGYTASANAQGDQAEDTTCAVLTLDHQARRLPADCW